MEFDSGLIIKNELDDDGDLKLEINGEPHWLKIEELRYILREGEGMIDRFYQSKFNDLEVNSDKCGGCEYLTIMHDVYGTGDSPTEEICKGSRINCHRVDEDV